MKPVTALMLIAAGAILTLAPVVYVAFERLIVVKVVAIFGFFLLALVLVIERRDLGRARVRASRTPGASPTWASRSCSARSRSPAPAAARTSCQSNWIRDKGFGMGAHIQRLVSPVTGREEAAAQARACVFTVDEQSLGRWARWWRFANLEQALTFVLVTVVTIALTSMLAHSTLRGRGGSRTASRS